MITRRHRLDSFRQPGLGKHRFPRRHRGPALGGKLIFESWPTPFRSDSSLQLAFQTLSRSGKSSLSPALLGKRSARPGSLWMQVVASPE
jgi:hypothetical protein